MEAFGIEARQAAGDVDPQDRTFPGAVAIAADSSGSFKIEECFGTISLEADAPPFAVDSPLWIASCTKLATSIAVLQLVERGLVTLDEDITCVIPEWKDSKVLVDFDDKTGEPTLVPLSKTLTLRHLLTHSSGMCYDYLNQKAQRYREWTGVPIGGIGGTLEARSLIPLLFQPGEGWEYGTSLDWAGVVVERLSGELNLESYMRKHIFDPLSISLATFHPDQHPDILSRLVTMFSREPSGAIGVHNNKGYPMKYDAGGVGIFTTPDEFVKLLVAVLRNDGTLISQESMEAMFTPQLPDAKYLQAWMTGMPRPLALAALNGLEPETKLNWGLAGLLNMEDGPGMRKKGSMSWGGLANLFWWIDRSSNVCGFFAGHIQPFGDAMAVDLYTKFEKAVYSELGKHA